MIPISVIIPTFHPGTYLKDCLQSLSQQTLRISDFEILLIHNGDINAYHSIVIEAMAQFPRLTNIRLFEIAVGGVSNARNVGLNCARGEFISFIDDDDFVSPNYLEELLAHSDRDTIGISYEKRYNEDNGSCEEESWSFEFRRKAHLGRQPYSGIRKFFSGPCMKLVHRDTIGSCRFDAHYTNGEDSLFMFLISKNFKYVDFTASTAVYYRRKRQGSAMSKERSVSKMWRNRVQLIREYFKIYFSDIRHYSFRFFATRVLGSLHSIYNSLIG